MEDSLTNKLVKSALVAAIYAIITIILQPISYGNIQFRLSEILILLAFIDSSYIIGLTVGCLVANFFGGFGIFDMIFGTLATFLSVTFISLTSKRISGKKSLFIASLWPTLFNGILIGIMLKYVASLPLVLSMIQVGLGEFVVVTIIGIPVFRSVLPRLKKVL